MLPPVSGLAMPDQVLRPDRTKRQHSTKRSALARLSLLALWLTATTSFAWTLYQVLSVAPPTPLQILFWILCTVCFAWASIGPVTAVIGFATMLVSDQTDTLPVASGLAAVDPDSRCALLFPVYRENPDEIAATITVIADALVKTGNNGIFDVFVLSDTQDENERVRERMMLERLRSAHHAVIHIHARWRTPNTAKKSGNIRDWIEHFGAAYRYFVILDADSIMAPETLVRLVATMEKNPDAGLIQTVPRLAGATTTYARLQQFAANYYGEILAVGLAAWHGPGGNYWGHNAIIRTRAFADAAGLPRLPGKPPLGGHILSHDFVEAALLRRAGWEVHLAPSLEGSFEGCPPTIGELVTRDRRWAQGNLQHLRLLSVRGLPFLSRLHLAMGAASYLASPLWALTLIVGTVLAVQAQHAMPNYFGSEASLFPRWPVFDAKRALSLFIATVLVIHLPKILGAAWAMRSAAARRANGGMMRAVGGVLLESIAATLIAPMLMLTQTGAVLQIMLGRDSGWGAQRRTDASAAFWDNLRRYRWHAAWGLAGAIVCWAISPAVLGWMSPIVMGLLLAAPMAYLTGRPSSRLVAQLLATRLDRDPPAILRSRALVRPK